MTIAYLILVNDQLMDGEIYYDDDAISAVARAPEGARILSFVYEAALERKNPPISVVTSDVAVEAHDRGMWAGWEPAQLSGTIYGNYYDIPWSREDRDADREREDV